MTSDSYRFIDRTGEALRAPETESFKPASHWPPVLVSKEAIDAEIQRLADLPRPENGRRQSMVVHSAATDPGLGLNPGVRVTLDVLKPGEDTVPVRENATQVNFCILGKGTAIVNDRTIHYDQYDVWNHPSYTTYQHRNDSNDLHARLTYSNASLLEMMRAHVAEENPASRDEQARSEDAIADAACKSPFGSFEIGDDGAMLMPYDILINPPPVVSKTLHWPWRTVKDNLDKLSALGSEYIGRRLYLLYNPMTGRFNGTTPSFFATMTIRPGGIIDRPHRHISAAMNYYFKGSGYSVVEGKRYDWKAGDFMVSAPGWAMHNHASNEGESVYELTIQDQPLNIAMESLLWQEQLKGPARLLGVEAGFSTGTR